MTDELETMRAELENMRIAISIVSEHADYGWKNVAVLERARSELQAEVDRMRELLKEKQNELRP